MALPKQARERLDAFRWSMKAERKHRIDTSFDWLVETAADNPHVRDLKHNRNTGMLQFRYSGRRVQYWIGKQVLVVMNAIGRTVYTEYISNHLYRDLRDRNPNEVFKVEPL